MTQTLYVSDLDGTLLDARAQLSSVYFTKAAAIAQLRQNHNLTDYELVVFGDENNDREMFESADRAIAVANATDSIKQIATAIIGHHVEDSVAQYLAQDWGRRRKPAQPR
ncbi:MAG: HAD hydrolase family protein [Synechococcales cyanobacterium CRU_2_2]|nr:HAD hydrolase family protein [Synechococcales cyanobacterium CRU_2_2]